VLFYDAHMVRQYGLHINPHTHLFVSIGSGIHLIVILSHLGQEEAYRSFVDLPDVNFMQRELKSVGYASVIDARLEAYLVPSSIAVMARIDHNQFFESAARDMVRMWSRSPTPR
jgi:hypothetical protein